MKRTTAFLCLLAAVSFSAACGGGDNTNAGSNTGNVNRSGVVDTNANLSPRTNGNTVPSNVGVLTNDNHNANTAGITSTNSNSRSGNANNANGNHNANNRNGNTRP